MKLNLFLLLLIFGCNKKVSDQMRIELQKDIFTEENKCKATRTSQLDVLSLNFSISEEELKDKEVTFEIKDEVSKNSQTIILKKDHYLYPNLNGKDHKEYNLPDCKQGLCEVELYTFISHWKNIGPKFDISLSVTSGDENQKFRKEIKNTFEDFAKFQMPEIKIAYDEKKKEASLSISEEDLDKIKSAGASEYEVVLLWRNKKDILYREQAKLFILEKTVKVNLNRYLDNPVYLAAMVMYKKNHHAFEIKREIMNESNDYFNCKK